MTVNFDKHSQKAHQFLSELRAELHSDDEAHANRVLKTEGQYEHVEAELPKDVKALMREAEFEEGVA